MDDKTLEKLAEFICGDNTDKSPIRRTKAELLTFFSSLDIDQDPDISTRKWWTLDILKNIEKNELNKVVLRLANPKEYVGEENHLRLAIKTLNEILLVERKEIILDKLNPKLRKINPIINLNSNIKDKVETNLFTIIPAPNFEGIGIDYGVAKILQSRWIEIQYCINAKAFLASIILMGSVLEGLLLGVIQIHKLKVNNSNFAPKNKDKSIKNIEEWNLYQMIEVAHDVGWLDLDVKKFSHILREFRNLIHPYQQVLLDTFPDEDTTNISWQVVNATCKDIERNILTIENNSKKYL